MSEAQQHWDARYRERDRVWSGRVNPRLAEIVEGIGENRTNRTALDLGCGEGADAIWLAGHGWTVTAVDISAVALQRAAEAAHTHGVADRVVFEQLDLSDGFPAGSFDLVSAQFLHSSVEFDRMTVLRRAATAVAPGGVLAVVDHAAAPPWARHDGHHHHFAPAEDVLDGLQLQADEWDRLRVGASEREATGPDGQQATLVDNLIVLRRKA
jgi:SAM-dependent methyltransferase